MTDGFDQTPVSLCRAIIARLDWTPGEVVLEPARGRGGFYDNLPPYVKRDWCEIKEGRDFFDWHWPVDTVITNPPFWEHFEVVSKSKLPGASRWNNGGAIYQRNLFIPFLEHSFLWARRRVVFLANSRCFATVSPNRLRRYEAQGWLLARPCIYSVKKWSGRYYLLTFVKDGLREIDWDDNHYE
jgi:hypothetical protein